MITMENILLEGNPVLSKKAKLVDLPLSKTDQETLILMREFLLNSQDEVLAEAYNLRVGIGLAAPQIGISKRMLVIYSLDENFEHLHDYMMINPKIISHTEMKTCLAGGEGCLSVDRDVEGIVPRYKRVRVKTYLYDLKTDSVKLVTLHLKNYIGIVFQHELDHLDGILFTEKVTSELTNIKPITFKTIEESKEEV